MRALTSDKKWIYVDQKVAIMYTFSMTEEQRLRRNEYMREYNRKYRAELRPKLKAKAIAILGGECVKCGSTERLEFDHINNDRKDEAHCISVMLISQKWSKIEEELKKCQLLCKSCHQYKNLATRGNDMTGSHGRIAMYTDKKCRCTECSKAYRKYQLDYYAKNKDKLNENKRAYRARKKANSGAI